MKNLAGLFVVLVLVFSCSLPVSNPGVIDTDTADEEPQVGVFISGMLPSASRNLARAATAVSDVESVLLFYGSTVKKVDVIDDSFSVKVDALKPAGIVFVGPGNSFKGYVDVGNDMSSLPLQAIDQAAVSMDFGVLTFNDKRATPANDPFQHLGSLTPASIKSLGHAEKLFSSVIQNPDFDKNGIIDLLENKQISARIMYYLSGTPAFGEALTPSVAENSITIGSHKFLVGLRHDDLPAWDQISVTYPSAAEPVPATETRPSGTSRISIFFTGRQGKPDAGAYRFQTSNAASIDYTFNVPDQSGAEESIVVLVPTVALNENGTMHSVSWQAFHRDMSLMDHIHHVFTDLEVQIDIIDSVEERIGSYKILGGSDTRVYNSGYVPVLDAVNIIAGIEQPILWADVNRIFFGYNDLYGNHYVLGYNK